MGYRSVFLIGQAALGSNQGGTTTPFPFCQEEPRWNSGVGRQAHTEQGSPHAVPHGRSKISSSREGAFACLRKAKNALFRPIRLRPNRASGLSQAGTSMAKASPSPFSQGMGHDRMGIRRRPTVAPGPPGSRGESAAISGPRPFCPVKGTHDTSHSRHPVCPDRTEDSHGQ